MGVSSLTLDFQAVLSTTLFNWAKGLENAISTANPFYFLLKKSERGYKEVSDLGERMAMPLMYELGNADSYDGYDQLDVTPMDGVTTAFFDWRQAAVPISMSGKEQKQNRGEEKMIDLLDTKTQQAELGIQEFFSKKLLQGLGGSSITSPHVSPINGSSFLDPLAKLVAADPTAALTIGNIPQNTYTWWRNQVTDFTGVTTFVGFEKKLRTLRNNCSKGVGGMPDLHILTQGVAELYEAALAARSRNPSYQVADIPFDNVSFHGKPATWDEFMPDWKNGTVTQTTGTWLMLNTQFWGVRVDKETNFTTTPFRTPENQDAMTAQILWMGGVGTSNRRKQGVGMGVDTTISA
jgi:hypothetical protein